MKLRNNILGFATIASILHCVIGNLVGCSYNTSSDFLELIFLPYSFIAGMSNFAGWDSLSIAFEAFGFIFMTFIFYLTGLLIKNLSIKNK